MTRSDRCLAHFRDALLVGMFRSGSREPVDVNEVLRLLEGRDADLSKVR